MESRVRSLGHSVHPMLVVYPLGLLSTAVIFDIVRLASGHGDPWGVVVFWMIAAGIVGGALAAVVGLIDWLGIPSGTRAKRIGLIHAGSNAAALACFAASWLMRRPSVAAPPLGAFVLSVAGFLLAGVGGWLGGELVERLGIGVHEGANPDAPDSLRHPSARSGAKAP